MKKFLLTTSVLGMGLGAFAQLHESFSTSPLIYQSAAIGDVPATWTQLNANGAIANSGAGIFTGNTSKAWLVAKLTNGDTIAASTSWFATPGMADAWLMSPQFSGITANTMLTWEELAPDASYPDGYELKVSTSASPVPTPADFTTTIYSTAAASSDGFTTRAISLAAYAGQTIRIAYRNNSNDKFYLYIDDINTVEVTTQRDIAVTNISVPKYTDGNITLSANVQSLGAQPVTSFRLNYQVGSNAPVSQVFSNPLTYLGTVRVSFSTPATITATSTVKVWVDQVNTSTDENAANDMMQGKTYFIANKPPKNVMLEEFTGAWCQYCPDGQTYMHQIEAATPGFIGMSIHNNDQMVNSDAQVIDNLYSIGYPSALIDRTLFDGESSVATDRDQWQAHVNARKAAPVPAKVTVTAKSWNPATREFSMTVKADFVADVDGDFRMGVILLENDVMGPNNVTGWPQVNAYNTVSGSEWFGLGNPILDFHHNHVVEAMLGGTWGDNTVIPASPTAGASYTKTFTYTLPAKQNGGAGSVNRWKEDDMKAVAYVSEYDADPAKRPVLNSEEHLLTAALGVNNINTVLDAAVVYPNPATENATLAISLKKGTTVSINVVDALGRVVFTKGAQTLGAGTEMINIPVSNLSAGVYNVNIITDAGTATQRFSVVK